MVDGCGELADGPVPPRDVRIHLADGREVPVDCVYRGVVDGCHHWDVVSKVVGRIESLSVGMLPGRTTVDVVTYMEES